MAPITDCMREGKFEWTTAANQEFESIKTKLTTTPVLVLPDFSLTFELYCDASKLGIGAVLSQQNRPMTYFSEKLTGARSRYSTYDMEFYAIIQAIKHWKHSSAIKTLYYSPIMMRFAILIVKLKYVLDMQPGLHFFNSLHSVLNISLESSTVSLMQVAVTVSSQ